MNLTIRNPRPPSEASRFTGSTYRLLGALVAASAAMLSQAQTCSFDDGNSQLTRYALGLSGAALVNGTDFVASDAPTIQLNIACPSCGLNITGNTDTGGNPVVTVADATIISRKLAGFQGASLTAGLALGSGTRNTSSAVSSFLPAGCGTGANGWIQGRAIWRRRSRVVSPARWL